MRVPPGAASRTNPLLSRAPAWRSLHRLACAPAGIEADPRQRCRPVCLHATEDAPGRSSSWAAGSESRSVLRAARRSNHRCDSHPWRVGWRARGLRTASHLLRSWRAVPSIVGGLACGGKVGGDSLPAAATLRCWVGRLPATALGCGGEGLAAAQPLLAVDARGGSSLWAAVTGTFCLFPSLDLLHKN